MPELTIHHHSSLPMFDPRAGTFFLLLIAALQSSLGFWQRGGMSISALKQSAKWALDTIPKALGIQKIPSLLPERAGANEVKLTLPSYAQCDTYSCGAIAGWSVLEFLRPDAEFYAFYADCAPCSEMGTSTTRLTNALRKYGVRVSHQRKLDFASVKKCIGEGKPILVVTAEGAMFDEDAGHWVVLYGCGWKPTRVFLSGRTIPGFSRQEMSWQQFKAVWSEAGEGLVCSVKKSTRSRNKKQQKQSR